MRESVVQSLRTLALYLLIGLPILIIVTRIWMPNKFENIGFTKTWKAPKVELDQEISGPWKFSILDNMEWKEAGFDDQGWEELEAPKNWESQGFEGYNGYAWYRKAVKIAPELRGKHLSLYLGKLDDVDEVYVDGKLVGKSGQFPPRFATAYNKDRIYQLSPNQTEKPVITLAVRVFDAEMDGGFIDGPLGFKVQEDAPFIEIPLEGIWNFKTSYKNEGLNGIEKNEWSEIYVPSTWEEQGFYNYDGYAIYQKEFELSEEQASDSWILVLGKVDDVDRTFINGEMIGSTGSPEAWAGDVAGNEWVQDRSYPIPSGTLKAGSNTVTVKVYDGLENGGIYEGPIGLVRAEDFTSFWKSTKESRQNVYCNPHQKKKGKRFWCHN